MNYNLDQGLKRLLKLMEEWTATERGKAAEATNEVIKTYHQGWSDAMDMARAMLDLTIKENK